MNAKFDSKVQLTKYKVLKEIVKEYWNGSLLENMMDIPARIIPGPKPSTRCCIYKERAIVAERVKMAIGGDLKNPNVIEVIELACDECPVGGYVVTDICRGCLAHKCEQSCKMKAIEFEESGRAHINKDKCIECGQCAKNCPYSAIYNRKRPCENACKIKAISRAESGATKINQELCTSCGACAAQCPFGAIVDKSYLLNIVDLIKRSNNNENYHLYAVVAPAVASQFTPAKVGQIISGIKKLGFYDVVEAALGADSVALKESLELSERNEAMTSSCCPAFVKYIETSFPQLKDKISHNPSPMVETSRMIKEYDKNAKVVFIGPCTAKKMEAKKPNASMYVDEVMTFEELNAMFGAKDIELIKLEESSLSNATNFGRIFARSGGLSEAVVQALKEQNSNFEAKSVVCQGLDECKSALLKLQKNALDGNFIEGMACTLGCVGGAGNITRAEKNTVLANLHAKSSLNTSMKDTTKNFNK